MAKTMKVSYKVTINPNNPLKKMLENSKQHKLKVELIINKTHPY